MELLAPPVYSDAAFPHVLEDGWRMHEHAEWIFNTADNVFLHILTNTVRAPVSQQQNVSRSLGHVPDLSVHNADELSKLITCAYAQLKGVKEGSCEDRIIPRFTIPPSATGLSSPCSIFAVLDGHGGSHCVDFVSNHLPVNIRKILGDDRLKRKSTDIDTLKSVIKTACQSTDQTFIQGARQAMDNSGTTVALCALIGPDRSDGLIRVLLGSLGDSQAVLFGLDGTVPSRSIVALAGSPLHKPSSKTEMERIRAAGGQVGRYQGIDRLVKKINQTTYGLSVSRAMGDYVMKGPPMVVSNIAEFAETVIEPNRDQFIVIGSDGIFDFLTLEKVGEIVASADRTESGLHLACNELIAQARARGSLDDTSCVIIDFNFANRPSKYIRQ